MIYERIVSVNDPDILYLAKVMRYPEISRYISLDENNYWNYVTTTENVFYFKVFDSYDLVAATHCEISNKTLYMDIMVIPQYQRRCIATEIIRDILSGKLPLDFDKIEVSIDETNTASIALFEKVGFEYISQEDELITYIYKVNK